MQAILIDPEIQCITSLSIDTDVYARIRQVIGCKSLSVAVSLPTQDTVFVDPAARLKGTSLHCFRLAGCPHPIVGRAVIVGCDHVGDSVDAHTNAYTLLEMVISPQTRTMNPSTRGLCWAVNPITR